MANHISLGSTYRTTAPEFTHLPRNQTVRAGDAALFFCRANGNPLPKIEFYIDGIRSEEFTASNPSYEVRSQSDGGDPLARRGKSLRIKHVTKADDSRVIVCHISNPLGTKVTTAQLRVITATADLVSRGYPSFTVRFSVLMMSKGVRAELQCTASGRPIPRITWLFNSLLLEPKDDPRYEVTRQGHLVIKRVMEKDAGMYQCQADNQLGTILSPDFQLLVRDERMKPVITNLSEDQSVAPGASVELLCTAVGSPTPSVSWHLGTFEPRRQLASLPWTSTDPQKQTAQGDIQESPAQSTEDGDAGHARSILTDVTEPVNCTCVAQNSEDRVEGYVSITIKDAPRAPPEAPTLVSATPTSLKVQWAPSPTVPGISPVIRYLVMYRPSSDTTSTGLEPQTVADLPASTRNISQVHSAQPETTLEQLQPFTNYTVCIVAVNTRTEFSVLSPCAFLTTGEAPPGDPPSNIRVSVLSMNVVKVFWQPPRQPNGIIRRYFIYYTQRFEQDLHQWQRFESESRVHEQVITHLSTNATYFIRMCAANGHSVGPVSEPLRVLVRPGNEAVLAKPRNFRALAISASEIQAHWDPPFVEPQAEDWLKQFHLEYRTTSKSESQTSGGEVTSSEEAVLMNEGLDSINSPPIGWTRIVLSAVTGSHLINQLTSSTVYILRLRALTVNGPGMPAVIKVATKEPVVAVRPTVKAASDEVFGFTVRALDSTSLEVVWAASVSTNHRGFILNLYETSGDSPGSRGSNIAPGNFVTSGTVHTPRGTQHRLANITYRHQFNGQRPWTWYRVSLQSIFTSGSDSKVVYSPTVRTHPLPPKPPRDLVARITSGQDRRVKLEWQPPQATSHPILGYRVRSQVLQPVELSVNISVQEYNTSDTRWNSSPGQLFEGATYEFKVAAFHEYSLGQPAIVSVLVPEQAPSGKPIWIFDHEESSDPPDQSVRPRHPTSIDLKWRPPSLAERNGMLVAHEIFCRVDDLNETPPNVSSIDSSGSERWVNVTMPLTGVSLGNLQENSNYKCYVRAWNRVGAGPWSQPLYLGTKFRLLPPPEHIRAVRVDPGRIFVSWQLPTSPRHHLEDYSGFLVWYSTQDDPVNVNSWHRHRVNRITSVALLEPVETHSSYVVRVSSLRKNVQLRGTGNWSQPVLEEQLPKVSSQWVNLTGLHCVPEHKGSLVVSITPPSVAAVDGRLVQLRINFTGHRTFVSSRGEEVKEEFPEREMALFPTNQVSEVTLQDVPVNTLHQVDVQPLFKSGSGLWGPPVRTSCHSGTFKPTCVPTPHPVSGGQENLLMVLQRVDESLGEIGRYHLLVVPDKALKESTNPALSVLLKEALRWKSSSSQSPFPQDLGAVVKSWTSQELFPRNLVNGRYPEEAQYALKAMTDGAMAVDVEGRVAAPLETGVNYRAVWMACLKVHNSGEKDELMLVEAQERLCTASNRSVLLNLAMFHRPPTANPMNGDEDPQQREPFRKVNTASFYNVVGGVILGAVFCVLLLIAVVLVLVYLRLRRRRQQRRAVPKSMLTSNGHSRWSPEEEEEEGDSCKQKLLLVNGVKTSPGEFPMQVMTDAATPQTLYSCNTTSLLSTPLMLNHTTASPPSRLAVPPPLTQLEFEVAESVDTGADLSSGSRATPAVGAGLHCPLPVSRLAEHISALKSNDGFLFQQEYESIDPGQQFTWLHSHLECNRAKNRYANVVAYDHSRVVLSTIPGVPGSDYINANYINGYRRQNMYIATQGPLGDTVADFWRMVWEQRCSTVVMMTRLEERSRQKCEQYWPSRGSATHANITVTLVKQMDFAYYTVRILDLHALGRPEHREVHHLQFTAWPDHGVPQHSVPLLHFIRRVRSLSKSVHSAEEAEPIVVHCSAGVGRTGAFLVLDAQLERMERERTVDVVAHVTQIRAQRNYMVQTEEQYRFIYQVLLEASLYPGHACFSTDCALHQLPGKVAALMLNPAGSVADAFLDSSSTDGSGTAMSQEFCILNKHCGKPTPLEVDSALLPSNQHKNRVLHALPLEHTRVHLLPMRGVEGSDYINASFVDGYQQSRAYIAAQAPLPDTVEDFWRMLWEHNVALVVMLTQLVEEGKERCTQYWPPLEHSARYNYLVVDPVAEYRLPSYVLREFHVTDARDNSTRTVRQFHFIRWPTSGTPQLRVENHVNSSPESTEGESMCESLWELVLEVHKTQAQFGVEGPLVVHCATGTGRTGVFLAMALLLERVHWEGTVDVYTTVRWLRAQRPCLVHTQQQYAFCYLALLHYLRTHLAPLQEYSHAELHTQRTKPFTTS